MATDPEKKAEAGSESKADGQREAADKFSPEFLVAHASAYLGHEAHVVAGALHKQRASLSVADAKDKIKAWLRKDVEVEED